MKIVVILHITLIRLRMLNLRVGFTISIKMLRYVYMYMYPKSTMHICYRIKKNAF